jgi:hypothetical protein
MSKLIPPSDRWGFSDRTATPRAMFSPKPTKSLQLLPYTLLGTILFAWVSSAHLNQFLSVYLVLLAAQLGTVGIYSIAGWLKSSNRQNF